ncbi:PKD domain-containing protein [Oryzomonas rubra]|uniref:PKD/Chitinase domain-containing protein n=1 Tax=Oryzomonas rubra TaxID=2509454 RepID=A0A5A9XEC2_9BACT|nr:hypothetical protein [Oryzomonas rubra]KAA0891326.1 hypothetical protein ET418_11115 [Oryzomonas rubra]
MLKRCIIILTLLVAMVPAMANASTAWWLTTKLIATDSAAGAMVVDGTALAKINTAYLSTYADAKDVAVTVTPAAGFEIKRVYLNGAYVKVPSAAGSTFTVGSYSYPGNNNQSLQVTLGTKAYAVVAAGGAGGTAGVVSAVDASSATIGPYTKVPYGGTKILKFAPNKKADGTYGNVTLSYSTGSQPTNVVVSAADAKNAVTVSISPVNADLTVTGTFTSVTANAGIAQTIIGLNQTITLDGSASAATTGSLAYTWSVIAKPGKQAITLAPVAKPTFTGYSAGTYKFQLSASNGTDTALAYTTVTVATTKTAAVQNQCVNCHNALFPAQSQAIYTSWSASKHATNPFNDFKTGLCATCHKGADTGSHPGAAISATFDQTINGVVTNLCDSCHNPAGSPYAQGDHSGNYKASNHFALGKTEFLNGCATCHKDHAFVATETDGKSDTCFNCHKDLRAVLGSWANFSIYTSTSYTVLSAPHGGGVATPTAGGAPGKTQYITQGLICSDCHGHNNAINADYAASGHGKNTDEADGSQHAWSHYVWSGKTATPPQNGANCQRCHSTYGFLKFANATTGLTRLAFNDGPGKQPNGVLACIACHKNTEGALRSDSATYATGYVAQYVPRPVTSGTSKGQGYNQDMATAVATTYENFGDKQNSNLCITCHSGRANAALIANVFAGVGGTNAWNGYSTVQTNLYQHAANPAQTVKGRGAYEFSNYSALGLTRSHWNIVGDGTQGPCVGCHYTSPNSHTLEAVDFTNGKIVSTVCVTCHTNTSFGDVKAAKDDYAALVQTLTNLITINNMAWGERADVNMGFIPSKLGRTAIDSTVARAQKNYGAWYNWQLATVYDQAAYVHNPAYIRKVIIDTIDYLDDGTVNGSATNALFNNMTSSRYAAPLTATQVAQDNYFRVDGGCNVCHSKTIDPLSGKTILPEYQASGHASNGHGPSCTGCHLSTGAAAHPDGTTADNTMQKMYTDAGLQCIGCHNGNYSKQFDGVVHFANATTATFKNISAGYVGYKGKGLVVCANCHFEFDPHGIGATTTQTFTAYTKGDTGNSYDYATVLGAWADSGHGSRSGAAWVPTFGAGGHDWRNSGSSVDFSANIPKNDCVRCHTADGFEQFFTSKFVNVNNVGAGDGAQKFNSPLACNACHQPDVKGSATFARYTGVSGVSTFYNVSSAGMKSRIAFKTPDAGDSNLCSSCHSGRVTGRNIAALVGQAGANFANMGFQNSHYMAAAGLMYAQVGFINFTGLSTPSTASYNTFYNVSSAKWSTTTWAKSLLPNSDGKNPLPAGSGAIAGGLTSTHRNLGTSAMLGDGHNPSFFVAGNLDQEGPCVTCHMQGRQAGSKNTRDTAAGHSLEISQAAYNQVCVNCHTSEGTSDLTLPGAYKTSFLEPQSEVFQNGLKLAFINLSTNYHISYSSAYPYFYDNTLGGPAAGNSAKVIDWTRGAALSQVQAARLMGAAFNLNVLMRDPGAYVHARSYARRLIYDAIDFLDDGIVGNQSVGATALAESAKPASALYGVYGKGTAAYVADQPSGKNGLKHSSLSTLATGTTESMVYLIGWSRTSGEWNSSTGTGGVYASERP